MTRSILTPPQPAPPVDAPDGIDVEDVAALVVDSVPRLMRWVRTGTRADAAPGLTVPQLRVMLLLRRAPGSGVSAVAEHQGVSLASASALVERLVRQGLVDRVQDPAERRRVLLTLTATGVERLRIVSLGTRRAMARALRDRSADELAVIAEAMELLMASVLRIDPVEARREPS